MRKEDLGNLTLTENTEGKEETVSNLFNKYVCMDGRTVRKSYENYQNLHRKKPRSCGEPIYLTS